eukprot:scaffold56322_cov19-Tisochrysis_lutea.AAC.2
MHSYPHTRLFHLKPAQAPARLQGRRPEGSALPSWLVGGLVALALAPGGLAAPDLAGANSLYSQPASPPP